MILLTKNNVEVIIDDEDFPLIGKSKIWLSIGKKRKDNAYIMIYKNKKQVGLHRFLMNITDPKIFIDHINGNVFDNRKSNLRICNNKENSRNSKLYRNNKSGYKGIMYIETRKKWRAKIFFEGKTIHLGYFNDKLTAAQAYNEAAIRYFGSFAKLNII